MVCSHAGRKVTLPSAGQTKVAMDVSTLHVRYPRLYHMAERGAWPSIKARGLLSATAALDLIGILDGRRHALEREHRPESVSLRSGGTCIVLRDQKPMAPARLAGALRDGLTPSQWYERLNGLVFLWAEERRLHRLLNAREFRGREHDVIVLDTKRLLAANEDHVWLSPMNSGNTFPFPHPRGMSIFCRISDYPTGKRGLPLKRVVEFAVDYSIPDIAAHVVEAVRMKGSHLVHCLRL